jgi:hypothetical protein
MRDILFALIVCSIAIMGCCASTTPSSSCPYGTFGETCSTVCDKTGGGDSCYESCVDYVRSAGLGDATTCCAQSVRMECVSQCKELEASTHGDTTQSECMDNCAANYGSVGIPMDSCAGLPY